MQTMVEVRYTADTILDGAFKHSTHTIEIGDTDIPLDEVMKTMTSAKGRVIKVEITKITNRSDSKTIRHVDAYVSKVVTTKINISCGNCNTEIATWSHFEPEPIECYCCGATNNISNSHF
ncbi:hypothetical protein OTK49_03185 [Vibrio coralliirubri]|nr:hypothetical protein [Vibrio coralliirubri]